MDRSENVKQHILALLFINYGIIFHMSNCKPTSAPPCVYYQGSLSNPIGLRKWEKPEEDQRMSNQGLGVFFPWFLLFSTQQSQQWLCPSATTALTWYPVFPPSALTGFCNSTPSDPAPSGLG